MANNKKVPRAAKKTRKSAQGLVQEALAQDASSLDLSGLQLEQLPIELFELKNLKELDLTGNRLSRLPDRFGDLIYINDLKLWGNPIRSLPSCLFELINLQYLHLGEMRLGRISPEISRLKKLRSLWVWENDLTELPDELALLPDLKFLAMGRNRLADLPPWFGQLNLEEISAFNNGFQNIPDSVFDNINLQDIDFSGNKIKSISKGVGRLLELRSLSIGRNPIRELPKELGLLKKLMVINVERANLSEVPVELGGLPLLESLFVDYNPSLSFPPREILALDGTVLDVEDELRRPGLRRYRRGYVAGRSRGDDSPSSPGDVSATINYLRECAIACERVWESKLLIVGEGQVGKTWLFEALKGRLAGGGHPPDTGTVGIEIGDLRLPVPGSLGEMKLSCWDFAGQSINHATHQFFFSSRALFLLVWSARAGWEAGKLRKWLTNIRDRAPGAKIILVSTQVDQPHSDYPEKDLLAEFKQIVHAAQVSSVTGENIEALKEIIARESLSLPMMGQIWPSSWRAAYKEIRELRFDAAYCQTSSVIERIGHLGIKGQRSLVLLRWLTELGDVLYFPDNPSLTDILVLDPQWVTKRVGEILADVEVKNCYGVLTDGCVNRLWGDLPNYIRMHLIEMMDCFDLAYRIPDDPGNRSVVVERLPENAPNYEPLWDSFSSYPELRLRFKLGSMHPGIPTWFIARCHRFSQNMHWVRGVLFGDARPKPRHLALIVANNVERKVDFSVRGPFPWGFLPLLVDGFIDTIKKRYPGLPVEKWVPCPGRRKDSSLCDNEVALEDLENLRFPNDKTELPIFTWQCPRCRKSHAIDQLLLSVSAAPPVDGVTLSDVMGAVVKAQAVIKDELSQFKYEQRKWIQLELVREWNLAQQAEESSCPTAFSLWPIKKETWLYDDELYIQLYCMNPECWHSVGAAGGCSFKPHKAGLRKVIKALRTCARWIRPLANLLPAAGAVAGESVASVAEWAKDAKNEMDLTIKVVAELEKMPSLSDGVEGMKEGAPADNRDVDLRSLKEFLDGLPFKLPYGGLRRVRTPEGHILWLCDEHSRIYMEKNF